MISILLSSSVKLSLMIKVKGAELDLYINEKWENNKNIYKV